MYHVSAQGVDEHMINVHYYKYIFIFKCHFVAWTRGLPQTFASLYYTGAPFNLLYVWIWSLIMVADTYNM